MSINEKNKPKSLQQKLMMIYHNDGILDIAVGLTILLLSFVMAFDSVWFIGLIGIPIILYIPLKEKISTPRIGLLRIESTKITKKKLIAYLVLGIGTLINFIVMYLLRTNISTGFKDFFQNYEIIIFAVILAGTLLVGGLVLNNGRFQIYALLSLSLVITANFTGLKVWHAVILTAVFIEAIGIYKLTNFLKEYPLETGE